MAQLLSIATGNASSASTWGLVNATSFVSSTETATALTTSRVGATTFTPGAITVAGIAVKLAVRTGTTGTMTVDLDQGGSLVTGTDVTINVSDLPVAATADLNGGWHYFEFASPVTLAAATAYSVKCKTSSSSQVSLFATSSSNWCRCLVTTTTQAPAAGDNMIVCGKYTGTGASTSYTVTWDITATTDFGNTPTAANSLLAPGLCVCNKGTLVWETTAATNYNMKMSNSIIIYSGGVYNQGGVGAECPRDSTMTLQFDCGANVDYGLTVRNLGTCIGQGLSRTAGNNSWYCKLNTNEAVNSTTLGVDTDTEWLDDDEIVVTTTTRTTGQCEIGALNGAAGASTLTVDGFAGAGGGLAAAHSGTAPTQAYVVLLTRNVKIIGASATLQAYIDIKATATVDFDWVEFKWLGSATANKTGISIATTTGSCSISYCSLSRFVVSGSVMLSISSPSGSNITIENNCTYYGQSKALSIVASSGVITINGNIFIKNLASTELITLGDSGCTFTNNVIVASEGNGVYLSESGVVLGTFDSNVFIGHIGGAIQVNLTFLGGTISNCTIWRCTGYALFLATFTQNLILSDCTVFGCGGAIYSSNGCYNTTIINLTSSGDTTYSQTYGINLLAGSTLNEITLINCDFGTASGIKVAHSTGDINITTNSIPRIKLINTVLASGTEIVNLSNIGVSGYISSQKHDQTAGLHKLWKKYGIITIDTATVQAGTTSMKMTPNSATDKLQSIGPNGGFKVQVASGQTCTPTVYVYEDGSYNGARARLILLRNDALGITSDVVLDTATSASDTAWEALTGTTAAATDDGVYEFCVDIDGTAGNVFIDTFSATVV